MPKPGIVEEPVVTKTAVLVVTWRRHSDAAADRALCGVIAATGLKAKVLLRDRVILVPPTGRAPGRA